jgi:hypothetical protein
MAKHVRELPPSLTEVAPHLTSTPKLVLLVRKVLSKSPDDRPQTAGELLRMFEDVRRELGLVIPSTTTSGGVSLAPTPRKKTSSLTWYVSLAAACVAFIGIGWLAKSVRSSDRTDRAQTERGLTEAVGADKVGAQQPTISAEPTAAVVPPVAPPPIAKPQSASGNVVGDPGALPSAGARPAPPKPGVSIRSAKTAPSAAPSRTPPSRRDSGADEALDSAFSARH